MVRLPPSALKVDLLNGTHVPGHVGPTGTCRTTRTVRHVYVNATYAAGVTKRSFIPPRPPPPLRLFVFIQCGNERSVLSGRLDKSEKSVTPLPFGFTHFDWLNRNNAHLLLALHFPFFNCL
jgi:hypothetical protein